ncbi:MAG: glycoside hydrolase family 15 protein [Marinilabiliaceae bacterium]|nr:glycoside hydrolase family 15 protein [Marinilabiliaceae bacterium]
MRTLDYGVIGNCKSAALISKTGNIEWFCLPKFDSPSVFAKILDNEIGGSFEINVIGLKTNYQHYEFRTNILITGFICETGQFEIHDFMPRYQTSNTNYYAPPDIIRYIKVISGTCNIIVNFNPKLNYASSSIKYKVTDKYIKAYTVTGDYDSIYMYTDLPKDLIINKKPILIDKDSFLLLSYNQKLLNQDLKRTNLKLQRTKVYWLNWAEKTICFKKYTEEIIRSSLILKLLSYEKTGAILAAVTTSLPETIGEVRNWDYRFCWIRDASMVIKVMAQIGHRHIAHKYLQYIISLLPDKGEKMQIMYGINGEKRLSEKILDHLKGYENSKPVRVGNAAYNQKQNDIFGILMDVIFQHFELYSTSLEFSEDLWTIVRSIVKTVKKNWKKPDRGIWEIRSENRHFTFSKVLCWVAIDRAIKIATILKQTDYIQNWTILKDEIKEDILINGWSEIRQSFVQSYGSEELDSSVLLMETYGFISADDIRFKKTVWAIQEDLEYEGLLFRYRNKDDFGKPQSAFTICSFWLIKSLYKIGQKEEAIEKFNQLLSYSNHLGLFSEDLDFVTKKLLGNFPQAYSHLALIDTAITLSDDQLKNDEQLLASLL